MSLDFLRGIYGENFGLSEFLEQFPVKNANSKTMLGFEPLPVPSEPFSPNHWTIIKVKQKCKF